MPQVTNAELKIMLERLTEDVGVCQRTLRGSNGNPGLVSSVLVLSSKVDTLSNSVDALEKKVSNDLVHAIGDEKKSIKFGSWEWVTEKAALPIMVALIVSFLAWFLTSILPDMLSHMGTQ